MTDGQSVPILVYHHVYPAETPELKPATFETGAGISGESRFRRQGQYIADGNWTVVSTTQIVDWLTDGAALPQKAIALYFDNGWLDTATVALLILCQFGAAATCFPIIDGIEAASAGKSAAVRTLSKGVVEKPFMTWTQVQKLLDAGWKIGAHTATHCKMADRHVAAGDEGVIEEALTANRRVAISLLPVPASVEFRVARPLDLYRFHNLAPVDRLSEHRPARVLRELRTYF